MWQRLALMVSPGSQLCNVVHFRHEEDADAQLAILLDETADAEATTIAHNAIVKASGARMKISICEGQHHGQLPLIRLRKMVYV